MIVQATSNRAGDFKTLPNMVFLKDAQKIGSINSTFVFAHFSDLKISFLKCQASDRNGCHTCTYISYVNKLSAFFI